MKTKNIFKWPKEIYIFWLIDFILGLQLIGAILLIFFKDWGGLTQTQTQILQSWFTFWIFTLEIPTGIYGDIKGKKHSVVLGYTITIVGILAYSITPNIWLFFLAEFLFALGYAFISGAKEAWIYDTAKRLNIQKEFREISIMGSNLHMLGMIVSSAVFPIFIRYFSVNEIFRLSIVPVVISLILMTVFIKKTEEKKEDTLKPNYLDTAKQGWRLIKGNSNLKKLAIYTSILASSSYFIIWLYQEALRTLSVQEKYFGIYRIILLISQIVIVRIMSIIIKKKGINKSLSMIPIVIGVSFIIGSILGNSIGIILILVFAGGIGLQSSNIFSKEINDEIDSKQRATVLSFTGMIKRLILTVFNPAIGLLVDSKGVFISFFILGLISLIAVLVKPKIKLK